MASVLDLKDALFPVSLCSDSQFLYETIKGPESVTLEWAKVIYMPLREIKHAFSQAPELGIPDQKNKTKKQSKTKQNLLSLCVRKWRNYF